MFPVRPPQRNCQPEVQLLSRDQYVLDTPDDPDGTRSVAEPLTGVTISIANCHSCFLRFLFLLFCSCVFFQGFTPMVEGAGNLGVGSRVGSWVFVDQWMGLKSNDNGFSWEFCVVWNEVY